MHVCSYCWLISLIRSSEVLETQKAGNKNLQYTRSSWIMDAPDFTHIILLSTTFLSVLRARNIQLNLKKARECSKTIYPIYAVWSKPKEWKLSLVRTAMSLVALRDKFLVRTEVSVFAQWCINYKPLGLSANRRTGVSSLCNPRKAWFKQESWWRRIRAALALENQVITTIERVCMVTTWMGGCMFPARLCADREISPESNSMQTLQKLFGWDYKPTFPGWIHIHKYHIRTLKICCSCQSSVDNGNTEITQYPLNLS